MPTESYSNFGLGSLDRETTTGGARSSTVTIPATAKGTPQLKVQESGGAAVSAYISGASVAASTAAC